VIENSSPIERSAALHLTKIAMVNLHPLVRSHVAIEARHFNSRSKKCGFSTFGETAADKPPLAQLAIISSKQTVNQARPAVSNAIWYSGSVKKAATESIDNDGQPANGVNSEAAGRGTPERMRRCRARYRCFTIELHHREVDELIHRGLLRGDDRDDHGAVIDAVSQHIEQTLWSPL
jgi:hypothetical protein